MIATNRVLACMLALSTCLFAGGAYSQPSRIVALGDSNTAGFGVGNAQAFPAQLEALLRATGYDSQVFNAGVSGDTTQGMLGRLEAAVPEGTQVVIVQGGYNDLQRGSSPATIMGNIDAILARLKMRNIRALLCGFYDQPWGVIARRRGAAFVPANACYDANYRGFDGLHMNAAGHQVVATRLLPVAQRLLLARPRR